MNTLFTQAPFARFDLGKHVMGQSPLCQPGKMPSNQAGRIVCIPYSAPSEMLMPSWPSGGVGYGAAMGQMEDPYLTQIERDQLLISIQDAAKKLKPLEDIISWSQDNDPQLKDYLGSDWSRFFALSNSIAPLYPTVKDLADRLAQTDAEYWYRPITQETADVKQYLTGIQEMYRILQAHKTPANPLPVTSKPPPSTVAPTMPVMMPKGGALTSTGPSTQDYLLGAGIAVGLGAVIYALLG